MHPAHRCMDTFHHQRNQMPYAQQYYPSFEFIPPPMKVDTATSPVAYETWPYGGNYGHPAVPGGCHGCCNHGNVPGYCGFRAPYPYYPPPPPYHFHGGYPSFPETFPVHYVPQPSYSMDQPRYEYDKNVASDHHCCGCPNHLCNRKEDRRVKIEEQEPELETKAIGEKKSSNALVPFDLKNQAYPVVWIPPGYMNREQRNPTEPKLKERDEKPHDTGAHENSKPAEQEPSVWAGQVPVDVNNFGSPHHGGDRQRTQKQPNQEMNQFPFPIFWMPYKPQEEVEGDHKEGSDRKVANAGWLSTEKSPNLKTSSADFSSSDDSMRQHRASEEKSRDEVGSKSMEKKHANQKTIPVKQLEEHEEKMIVKKDEAKARGVTAKQKEENKEKLLSENGAKKCSSPPKTSKLPPVCLRVDPLPKRKNVNGDLRSPSPTKKNTQHDTQSSSCTVNKTKEAEPNEKERKVVKVVDGVTREENGQGCKIQSRTQVPVSLLVDPHEEVVTRQSTDEKKLGEEIKSKGESSKDQSGGNQLLTQEEKEESKAKEENPDGAKKAKRSFLSEAEAAVVIQSAYRGFEVRRWEPLKKMKRIAEVKEQVADVKSRVEALESSLASSGDNKQRVVLGETIMSLLLKLDTIQGLHPTVRDFRKSVAKELVSLQEKLDSLPMENPEVSTAKLEEDLSVGREENASIQGEQKEAEVRHGNGIGECDQDSNFGSLEPCQGQVFHLKESTSDSQAVETPDLKTDENEVCEEPEGKITACPFGSSEGVDEAEAEAEAVNKLEDGLNNEMLDDGQASMLKTQTEDLELKPPVEPLPLVAEEKVDSQVDEVKLPSCPVDQLENEQNETGDEVETLLAIDGTSKDGEIVDANQVRQPLVAVKDEQAVADMEGEGTEEVSELHEDVEIKPLELLVQSRGEEVSHFVDHVETSIPEDGVSLKESEPLEDAGMEVEELTVQNQGQVNKMNAPLDSTEQQDLEPELSLAPKAIHGGEAPKLEEPHPVLSLLECEAHEEEASTPDEQKPELLPAGIEIHGREQKEECGMANDAGNSWEEKEVQIEVTKECKEQSKVIIGEENQELVEDRHELEGLESVPGTDDRKLLGENEKLREMMEKLIEAGREQLSAISNLSGRVKDLEKKLARKKKLRTRQVRAKSSSVKPSNDSVKGRAHGVAA